MSTTGPPAERSRLRRALVACRAQLGAAIAEVIARVPAFEPAFIRVCRWSAADPGLVFGLCWAVNQRLNDRLTARDRQYREVTVGALRVWLDVTDQSGFGLHFYADPYEPLLTRALFDHLQEGDVFVDVGANVGLFTLLAAKIVGPRGRIVAFEPHPDARAALVRLLERNGIEGNVDVVGGALADRPGVLPLHLTDSSGLSTLDPSLAPARTFAAYTRTVPVDVTTLDLWMAAHPDLAPRVALIKIDVEGVEDRVVAGMTQTLRAAPRARVICETAIDGNAERQLREAGFDAISLEPPQGGYVGNRFYSRPPVS